MKKITFKSILFLALLCFGVTGLTTSSEAKVSNETIMILIDRFEHNPQIVLLLLNMLNDETKDVIEKNSNFVTTDNNSYVAGDTIYVSWDFEKDKIECAELESNGIGTGLIFFCDKVHGDKATKNMGRLPVKTNSSLTYPGEYRISLTTTAGKTINGRTFNINPSRVMESPVLQVPSIQSLDLNINDRVDRRDNVRLAFKAEESRFDTERAEPSEGFSLNLQIREPDNTIEGKFISSHEGYYDYNSNQWYSDVKYPSARGNYTMKVSFWCSNTNKVCNDRYPNWGGEYKTIPFTVE